MHACTIKIHLKIILCFWVQLGLAHCCPVHSLLMIYIANCLILKINHTSYLSHIISAFDKFSSTFLLITMSFWLLSNRWQFISQGDCRLEFQEIPTDFLTSCILTVFINFWHLGDTVVMIILSWIILKSAKNSFLNNYYKHLPLIFPCKISKLSF